MTTAQYKIGSGFDATSTAGDVLQGIDLSGKLARLRRGPAAVPERSAWRQGCGAVPVWRLLDR
jgi:hypothetical protein